MKIKLIVDARNLACPLCHDSLAVPDATHTCEDCGHLSHKACNDEFQTCGSMECFGTGGENAGLWVEVNGTRHRVPQNADITTFEGGIEFDTVDGDTIVCWDSSNVMVVREAIRDDLEGRIGEETLVNWAMECIEGGATATRSLECFLEEEDTADEQCILLTGQDDYEDFTASEAFEDSHAAWEWIAVKA